VALIVKMDDIGLHMARRSGRLTQAIGRGLVRGMPVTMSALTTVGTAAMLWVGGGIIVHGLAHFGLGAVPHLVEGAAHAAGTVPVIGPVTGWAANAGASAVVGLLIGGTLALVMHLIPRRGR
jgi:hypothetical protein